MAELLIKAVDAMHSDPEIDQRGCYKRGMPVNAWPDGHPWGREERLPKFWRVRLVGVQPSLVQMYCAPLYAGLWVPGRHEDRILRRRRWTLHPDMLTVVERRALLRGDIVELSWSAFQRSLWDTQPSVIRIAA